MPTGGGDHSKYMKDVGVTIKLQKLEAGTQATYSRNRDPREGHMTLGMPGPADETEHTAVADDAVQQHL